MNDYKSIIKEIKNKQYKPIYILMGEEGYYIDLISNLISKEVLTTEEKEFNYSVMYGRDVEIGNLINAAKRFPMMAPYNLIIVKEAQNIAKIEHLEYYLQKPLESTILVLEYRNGKVDARKKYLKLAHSIGVVFTSNPLYDDKIPNWITSYLKDRSILIAPQSSQILCEYLGNDLSKIVNTLDQLIMELPSDKKDITPDIIERKVGISKDYNNFELLKTIVNKDVFKSNRIVNYFLKNPKNYSIIPTLAILFNFFSNLMVFYYLPDKSRSFISQNLRVPPFLVDDYVSASNKYSAGKVMNIISEIRLYDARSKGVNNVSTSSGELLKELIYKILH